MSTYKFSINVVARHPSYSAEKISTWLGWEPCNAWSVGDACITPSGTLLSGSRSDTMCAFRFEHDDDQLTLAAIAVIEHLRLHRTFILELLSSGGTLELNIGFNGNFHASLDLPTETLQYLCDLRVRLTFECFPDG